MFNDKLLQTENEGMREYGHVKWHNDTMACTKTNTEHSTRPKKQNVIYI